MAVFICTNCGAVKEGRCRPKQCAECGADGQFEKAPEPEKTDAAKETK